MIDPASRGTGLILGSASPRRSFLLRQIGAEFDILAADIDETQERAASPDEYVSALSAAKAEAVLRLINENIKKGGNTAGTGNYNRIIIIGADTIVVDRSGGILGKPEDASDAKRMLGLLSGNWHEVYTGLALVEARLQDIKDHSDYCTGDKSGAVSVNGGSNGIGGNDDAVDGAVGGAAGNQASHIYLRGRTLVKYERTRVKMCGLDAGEIEDYVETGEPFGKAGAYAIQGAGALFIERVEGCFFNVVGLPLRLLYSMLSAMDYILLMKKG